MRRALIFLLSCAALAARADSMLEVSFMDQRGDAGGGITRYLVTDRYLRMDYGQERDDYVLFDRQKKRVYNVTHDQRTIMLIEPGVVTIPKPEKWKVNEDTLQEERGKRSYDIEVNDIKCSRITAAQNFLPDFVDALGDFNELMAATQAATYLATPPELRHPCELARYVLEPRRWIGSGFPLYEANTDGSIRRLLDYKTGMPIRPSLFKLPETYRTIRLRDMQGGSDAKP